MSDPDDLRGKPGWSKDEMDEIEREIHNRGDRNTPAERDEWFHQGGKDWIDRYYPTQGAESKAWARYQAALEEADGDQAAAWESLDDNDRWEFFGEAGRSQIRAALLMQQTDEWDQRYSESDDEGQVDNQDADEDDVVATGPTGPAKALVATAVAGLVAAGAWGFTSGGDDSASQTVPAAGVDEEPGDESGEIESPDPSQEPDPDQQAEPEPAPEPEEIPNGWDEVGDTKGGSGVAAGTGGDGADLVSGEYWVSSHGFRITVAGNGRALAEDPLTKWYKPRFVINYDPTTDTATGVDFSLDVGLDDDPVDFAMFSRFTDELGEFTATAEWIDDSTFEVILDLHDLDVTVQTVRVEMTVRTVDDTGATADDYWDDMVFTVEP